MAKVFDGPIDGSYRDDGIGDVQYHQRRSDSWGSDPVFDASSVKVCS